MCHGLINLVKVSYLHGFKNMEEEARIIGEFIERHNSEWIMERLGYKTPAAVSAEYHTKATEAKKLRTV